MYVLCLNVTVNSVTCPGVWMCPKGQVMLKITIFGQSRNTRRIHPKFPLNFNETFNFQRIFVGGLQTMAEMLQTQEIHIELIQWMVFHSKLGVVLAKYNQHLSEIFEPFIVDEMMAIVANVDLLTNRTEYFPGIISPKLRVKIDMKIYPCRNQRNDSVDTVSKLTSSNHLFRQRAVCHSTSRLRHSYCDYMQNEKCFMCSISQDAMKKFDRLQNENQCDKSEVKNSFCSWCDFTVSSCNCSSCWKYHSTFH